MNRVSDLYRPDDASKASSASFRAAAASSARPSWIRQLAKPSASRTWRGRNGRRPGSPQPACGSRNCFFDRRGGFVVASELRETHRQVDSTTWHGRAGRRPGSPQQGGGGRGRLLRSAQGPRRGVRAPRVACLLEDHQGRVADVRLGEGFADYPKWVTARYAAACDACAWRSRPSARPRPGRRDAGSILRAPREAARRPGGSRFLEAAIGSVGQ